MVNESESLEDIERILAEVEAMDRPSPRLERFERLLLERKTEENSVGRCMQYLEDFSRENEIQLYYLGGFLRDLWLGMQPRDIDLVFNRNSENAVRGILADKVVRKNRFGGLKLRIEGTEIDAWPIESTWTYCARGDPLACAHHLPSTTFFNAESILLEVYGPHGLRWGWEKGFFDACERRELEIQNFENPFPGLQLVRTYALQKKLGWTLGPWIREFVKRNLQGTSTQELAEMYRGHYGLEVDGEEVYRELRKLTE